jgi:hypothetical protein
LGRKQTLSLLFLTLIVVALAFLSPHTSGASTNPCRSCHSTYYQNLDILEGDSTNQIPAALNLNETKTVSVAIENSVNTDIYSTMSGVTITLNSMYNHFSVSSPTVSIGDMPPGQKSATWQITGISDGFDYISISASGYNPHSSSFSDTYLPYPLITVGNATGTPPSPASPSSPTPPSSPSTSNPKPAITPTPSPDSSPSPTPTESPNSTTPPPDQDLSILMISPAGNEKWPTKTMQQIEWNASGGTSPLTITIEYTMADTEQWTTIGTSIPNNGSITWTTPNLTAFYEIRATVNDSAIPSLTASATKTFEVIQTQTNSEFPAAPITIAVLSAAVVGVVLLVRKKRNSTKLTQNEGCPVDKAKVVT